MRNLETVKIGDVEHPMLDNHYIEWVSIQTKFGNQRKLLKPGDKPEVVFAYCFNEDEERMLFIPDYSATQDYETCDNGKIVYLHLEKSMYLHS